MRRQTEVKKGRVVPPPGIRASWTAVDPPKPRKFSAENLITVIVREEVKSSSKAKAKQERDYSVDTKLDEWIRLSHWKLWGDAVSDRDPAIKFNLKTKTDNRADADREDKVTTRIQARVVDVKPNGNLILEAMAEVEIEEDEYKLTLTGICRTADVTPDNTILSTQLHDKKFRKVSTGATKDGTKRGWLAKILDKLRPV